MDKLVSQAADIGAAIASTRKRSKIRQQDLADLAGVSCRFLSDLENGKESVELGKALRVLSALGLDLELRFRGAGGQHS